MQVTVEVTLTVEPRRSSPARRLSYSSARLFQGETPRQRAANANDPELADYLKSCQHYQMIQREDQETTV